MKPVLPTLRRPQIGTKARPVIVAKKPRRPLLALADADDPLDEGKYPKDPRAPTGPSSTSSAPAS